MKTRACRKCGKIIPNKVVIDGKEKNLQNRKFCFECSPYKSHNTKVDIDSIPKRNGCYSNWADDEKNKNRLSSLKRGLERKQKLIVLSGSKCKCCNKEYTNCERVFCFHHKNPKEKLFGLSMNNLWSKKWELILEEFTKCEMLCQNCHAEVEEKIARSKPNYQNWLD